VRLGLLAALVVAFLAAASAAAAAAPVGAYRLAGGGVVALVPRPSLRLVDYGTGALRSLTPRTPSVYVGGPGVSVTSPVSVRVRLGPGGTIAVDGSRSSRGPRRSPTAACASPPGSCARPGRGRSPAS
jgi:hypothetical protein